MQSNYYEKYWKKELSGKSQFTPPEWTKENLDWHLTFFKDYIGKNILDVGSGEGTFLNFIKKNNQKSSVDALEISKLAIEIGHKKHPKINFIHSDIESLNISKKYYDTVFAIEVLEHLLDIDRVLENINHLTKKNGYLCVTTTDFNLLKRILISVFFWGKYFYPNNPHIRFFTRKTLIDICKNHGFRLVKYQWNKSYFGIMPKGQMAIFQKV
jgi:2-polyprenyl-3-methyl-5-hydroxy-6-metoxy-1,4-benzoquinol methylase